MARKPNKPAQEIKPLCAAGRFLVLVPDGVQVHLLDDIALGHYWEGLRLAETRTRDPVQASQLIRDKTFRVSGSLAALPAPGLEALLFLMDTYQGQHQETVRAYAAAMLLGRPFGGDVQDGPQDGGSKVPAPTPAPKGPRPGGAAFTESDLLAAVAGK